MVWHRHALDQALVTLQGLAIDHLFELRCGGAGGFTGNAALFFHRRVIDRNQEHKAVQLRLGQRIGALLLNRVLRSQHKERLRERAVLTTGGHAMFLHGLQQRTLRLGRRPVNFVRQNDVGKDWALYKFKLPSTSLTVLQNLRTRDVAGHQVGRKLDPVEVQVHDLRERIHHQRFRQTRHTH